MSTIKRLALECRPWQCTLPVMLILWVSVLGAQTSNALPGDSLLVGPMTIDVFGQIQSLAQPNFPNQKYCGLVQLAPGMLVEAYVPSAAEAQGDFSAFAGLLIDPLSDVPFPGGIIPSIRLPDPMGWRISGQVDTGQPGCATFPSNFVPFSSVYYTSAQIDAGPISITSATPSSINADSGSFTLTIYGSGFSEATDTTVLFDETPLTPAINLGVLITVSIPNDLIIYPETASISVGSQSLGISSNVLQIPVVTSTGPFLNVISTSSSSLPELQLQGTLGTGFNANAGQIVVSSSGVAETVQAQVMQLEPTTQQWITVTPASFTVPSADQTPAVVSRSKPADISSNTTTIEVNLDATGLAAGSYDAVITLMASANGTVVDTKSISVSADFGGVSLIPAPGSLSFSYLLNGLIPGPKTLDMTPLNLSTGQDTFTASASVQTGNWLAINATTGNLPGSTGVSINPAGLSPGKYIGQLSLEPDALAPVIVDVALTVKSAPDSVVAFPPYPYGGLPAGQSLPVMTDGNPSGFYLDLNSELNWLQVNPLNGNTPNNLQFSANPVVASLTPGAHIGYASVVDQFNPSNVFVIGALINVPAPPLVISNTSLPNGVANQAYSVTLSATGGIAPLTWSILSASLPTGLSLQGATISGTPTASGNFNIPVTVTDSSVPPLTATAMLPLSITAPVVTVATPVISSVSNAASGEPFFSSNAYVAITGSNLASVAATTWSSYSFPDGQLPTTIGGVSVTINGKPAYVNYVSAIQINALSPVDNTTGNILVTVTNDGVQSDPFTVPLHALSPAFFEFGGGNVAATHVDGSPVAPVGTYPTSRPASPNEIIEVWGNGFGPTTPAVPDGQIVSGASVLVNQLTVQVGGVNADVPFAGLVGAGLYQINVRIPPSAPDGDLAIQGFMAGVRTVGGVVVSVQH